MSGHRPRTSSLAWLAAGAATAILLALVLLP